VALSLYPCGLLVAVAALVVGCGYEFNKTFDGGGGPGETDDSGFGTDTRDRDGGQLPLPDFSLIGFAGFEAPCTGGAGGEVVSVSTRDAFIEAVGRSGALTVRVVGAIDLNDMVSVAANKSILGIGDTAAIVGGGLRINGTVNVIIRNLSFSGSADDAINIENSAEHIWIDHNDLSSAADGLIDIKDGGSHITISWNVFHTHDKVCLIGASDDDGGTDINRLKVTLHHNWFRRTMRQHPRCRFGEIHVFNNYLDNNAGYGIASTTEAKVLSEANYFLNVVKPFSIEEGTSPPGYLQSENDHFEGSGTPITNGEAFNPEAYYAYVMTPVLDVPKTVSTYAGVGVLDASDL
jgi:pectate lyase